MRQSLQRILGGSALATMMALSASYMYGLNTTQILSYENDGVTQSMERRVRTSWFTSEVRKTRLSKDFGVVYISALGPDFSIKDGYDSPSKHDGQVDNVAYFFGNHMGQISDDGFANFQVAYDEEMTVLKNLK